MTAPRRLALALGALLLLSLPLLAADPDLSDYRTVEQVVAAKPANPMAPTSKQPAFLGVCTTPGADGRLCVAAVAQDSPAAKAGVQSGDLLAQADGKEIKDEEALAEVIGHKAPGETLRLRLVRKGKPVETMATLGTVSRPLPAGRQRASLGVRVASVKDREGLTIEQVLGGSPAEKAKLKTGEVLLKFDGTPVTSATRLDELLGAKKPDDMVTLTLLLAEKAVDLKLQLGSEPAEGRRQGGGGGWTRGNNYWSKPVYHLAVICIEYPDVKHNSKIPTKAWQEAFFSTGTYTEKSATGEQVHGSLNDYYLEQSFGKLKVEGKVFDYVEVSKKREAYATGERSALLIEATEKLLARDGKDALKDYEGVVFIYAGANFQGAARGSLYWPHRANFRYKDRSWPYFICPEGGNRMANTSVFCHEFGHMLGLPDLYARPENPGEPGVGMWCAMSNQAGNGRPQHFCAWSKEKLGWIQPTVLDPTVKQKLILAPIEQSQKECFKILLRPDGSEYLLLENRSKRGFDKSVPAEGLLIWRVIANHPTLEESHGVEGPNAPRIFTDLVPYPSEANDAFTPYTTPSSRSHLGGGPEVYITNIRRLADGRIAFQIGYQYE